MASWLKIICLMFLLFLLVPSASAQTISGCQVFPVNNIWNYDISSLPIHANSANFMSSIGLTTGLKADFGAGLWDGGPIGIPFITVPETQQKVPVSFDYADESDPGPYPVPANAPIEGGANSTGDRHVLVLEKDNCILYELYYSFLQTNGSWQAGSGAIWDLKTNNLRPLTWTSADAAGLPILPGLVRFDEVNSGEIKHAIRFTVQRTQKSFLWPATHYASSITDPNVPPMGLRVRLKQLVNISTFSARNQVILTAMKKYGLLLADNGSNWYISGVPDERWNNDDLQLLRNIKGSDFEAVDESGLMISQTSGQVKNAPSPSPQSADFNSDQKINAFDFGWWISLYQQASLRADINGNGQVNLTDVAALIMLYL